jgi:alanyl-tRNA synthetase
VISLNSALQGPLFPELTQNVDDVKKVLNDEERSFSRTFDQGERLFEKSVAEAKQSGAKKLSDETVWLLWDTYGFPIDLTRLMAEELGLGVNEQEFEKAQAAKFGESQHVALMCLSDLAQYSVGKKKSRERNKLKIHKYHVTLRSEKLLA